jgi:hypothetical protein
MQLSRIAALLLLFGVPTVVLAQNLKIVLIETKTGRPLRGKLVCVSFSPNVHATGIDQPKVCDETNSKGRIAVIVPQPRPEVIHVSVLTNRLLPCFPIPHSFSVTQIAETGIAVPNKCASTAMTSTPEQGLIALFAHQMTFWEKVKDAWRELL